MSFSICRQLGVMSIVIASQPRPATSRSAWLWVRSLVANPGSMTPRMSLRGRPISSIALTHTSSAWVESSPPLTPITALRLPVKRMRVTSPCTWMSKISRQRASSVAGLGRHVGEALVRPLEQQRLVARQRHVHRERAKARRLLAEHLGALAEARLACAFLHEAVEIDVRHDELRGVAEALGLGERVAVLVDQAVAVPGEIGGRFARPRPRCTRSLQCSARTGCPRAAGDSRPSRW
jgi:hypothetical protein